MNFEVSQEDQDRIKLIAELEATRKRLEAEKDQDRQLTECHDELTEKVRALGREVTSGTLRVRLERAELIRDTEMIGKMDPYVVFA